MPTEVKQVADPLFASLSRSVKSEWKNEHVTHYKTEIRNGERHEAFIYNFIVHACGDRLESGRYHIYRGVLNFEGDLYRQLFEHSINTMISSGEYSKEWADEHLRFSVYKGIKEAG
ncbi:MAG: hypothetical protein AB1515_07205 [Nitrospirota bacterium]